MPFRPIVPCLIAYSWTLLKPKYHMWQRALKYSSSRESWHVSRRSHLGTGHSPLKACTLRERGEFPDHACRRQLICAAATVTEILLLGVSLLGCLKWTAFSGAGS